MSRFLLPSLQIILVACTPEPAPRTNADTVAVLRDTTDTFAVPLTAHYIKLLRAQLTAKDPYQAAMAIHCEQGRIMTLLTNEADDPLKGENKAVALLHWATERAYSPADRRARDRVEQALNGRVFDAEAGCDSLARAGVLGDTVMPKLRRRRF